MVNLGVIRYKSILNYAGSCDKFKTSKNLNNFNICLFHANDTFKNEGMVLTQSQEKLVSTI